MGHSCVSRLCDTLVGHSCRTLLWDTLVGHSCGTCLQDTLVGHSCRTPLWGTTKVSKSQPSRLQNEQKSHVKSTKQACRARLLPNSLVKSLRTNVSRKTSSTSHTSSTRLPPKVQREAPSEHTHQAALPSSFAIPAPPNNTRPHANPNVTATFTSTTTRNLTIPCACHENLHVHTSNTRKVLRLPRNATSATPRNLLKSENIISCELQQDLHHSTRLEMAHPGS